MKHHPDRGGDVSKFREIARALAEIERKCERLDPFEEIFKDVAKRSKS